MVNSHDTKLLFGSPRREANTVSRLLEAPYAFSWLWEALGISYPFCWIGVSITKEFLLGDFHDKEAFSGDVDLLAGPLFLSISEHARQEMVNEEVRKMPRGYIRQYDYERKLVGEATAEELDKLGRGFASYVVNLQLIREGHLKWPPDGDYMAAVNIKVSWYSQEDELKSSKRGRIQKFMKQAENLSRMGFDKVLHLHFVVTEPTQGEIDFFLNASRGVDALSSIRELYELEADKNHSFGIALVLWSPAPPGTEANRGGVGRELLREVPRNPFAESREGRQSRKLVAQALCKIFAGSAKPRGVPIYFSECQEKRCHRIFVTNDYMHKACWPCRKLKIESGIEELKKALEGLYGSCFERLFLFGSWARGEAEEGSDVDLLLVLKNSPDPSKELEKGRPIITALSLKYDTLFSVIPIDSHDWHKGRGTGFFAAVVKEGKLL